MENTPFWSQEVIDYIVNFHVPVQKHLVVVELALTELIFAILFLLY